LLSKVLSLLAVLSSDVPSISGRCSAPVNIIKRSLSQSDEVSSKITKIAITVSAVFASSYVPLFVIKLLTSIINQEELTSAQFAVLKIVERSYVNGNSYFSYFTRNFVAL
jgi:hypothetical protein